MSFELRETINTWPSLLREPNPIWSTYLELCRTEKLDAAAIENGRRLQLLSVLEHAVKHVPYYRELLGGKVPKNLESVPVLTRRTLIENKDQLTANRLPPGQHMMGTSISSGTSGEPVHVQKTSLTHLLQKAFFLRSLSWSGFAPSGVFAEIRHYPEMGKELRDGAKTPALAPHLEFLTTSPCHVMDVHTDPADQLRWLSTLEADYLVTFPSTLLALAKLNLERTEHVFFKGILCLSEPLDEATVELAQQSFGCSVVNLYSSFEVGYIAMSRGSATGPLSVFPENVFVEIVDDAYHPVDVGRMGRVLVTTLQNYAMPLVRYDIGDTAMRCSRDIFQRVQKPMAQPPLFPLANGKQKSSASIRRAMQSIGGTWQYRVTQYAFNDVVVDLVPRESWSDEHARRVARELQDFFEVERLTPRLRLHASRLPLTKSGKSPDLVSRCW